MFANSSSRKPGALLLILLLSLSVLAQKQKLSPIEQLRKEIPKIIFHDTEITFEQTPGFIVGIIDGDSTFILPFGSAEIDSEEMISSKDRFCLGGNSKVFTGLLTRVLEDKDKLSVEENLNDFLDKKWRNEAFSHLTIADLLSHHSGLPKIPPGIGEKEINGNLYGEYSKLDLLNFFKDFKPIPVKSNEYKYSHLNYGILEIALENRLQMPFKEIMQQYLINPLELSSIDYLNKNDQITTGYNLSIKKAFQIPYASNNAALGLVGSMNDLLSFLRIVLNSENHFSESITNSLKPINGPTYTPFMHMASGWQIIEIKRKRNLYFHNGKAMGHHTFMAMYPSTKTAIVVLANSEYGTHDLGLLIMRMVNKNWKRKK